MKDTDQVAVEQPLEKYLNGMKMYFKKSVADMELRLMRAVRDYHPYEGLLKKKSKDPSVWIITPRGIDFFQEVLMKAEVENRFAKTKRTEMEKRKLIESLDLKWTEKWIAILFNGTKSLDDFLEYGDGSMRSFEEKYGVSLARQRKDRTRKEKVGNYWEMRGQECFIKKEGFKTFVVEFYYKDLAKKISKELRTKCERLEKVLPYVYLKEFPELIETKYRVKEIRQKEGNSKRPFFVAWDSQRMQQVQMSDLKKIKEILHMFHPHEILLYKEPKAKESEKDKLYFTACGYDWYANVFRPRMRNESREKDFNGWVETEDVFMKRALRAEKVGWEEGLSDDWRIMMDVYDFPSSEFLERMLWMAGIKKDLSSLTKEDFEKLEEEMPVYRIRRYSFLFSKTERYKKGQMTYDVPKKIEKKNREWIEVESLKNGWHEGRILNRNYYTGRGVFSILVLPMKLEDGKKMKMRIPYKAFQDSAFQNLFLPYQKMRFEVEEVEVNGTKHKRIRRLLIGKQIVFRIDWDKKSPMWYVPIPEIGRKKKGKPKTDHIKEEFKNAVNEKDKGEIPWVSKSKGRKFVRNKAIKFVCPDEEYKKYRVFAEKRGIPMSVMCRMGMNELFYPFTDEMKEKSIEKILSLESKLDGLEIQPLERKELKEDIEDLKKMLKGEVDDAVHETISNPRIE